MSLLDLDLWSMANPILTKKNLDDDYDDDDDEITMMT